MILGQIVKNRFLEEKRYPRQELHAVWFAIAWPEIRDGKIEPRKVVVNDRWDMALFYPDDILQGEDMPMSQFVAIHYKHVQKTILQNRILVLDTDPPRFVHTNDADEEDRALRMDMHDALSVLREIKDTYG